MFNILCVLILLCSVSCQENCDYLKNIKVQISVNSNGDTVEETVNGCIKESSFGDKNVNGIYIKESLPHLGKDSVSDLPNLKIFSTLSRDLNELEPGAFRNVPELQSISLRLGKLKEVYRGIFDVLPKLETVRISNHQIDYIEDQAFANLINLKKVLFQYNQLAFWNREWFKNCTQLENLSFSSNKIKSLPRNAFSAFPKIRVLDFNNNEISVIHRNAFQGINQLNLLGLAHNRLTILSEDIFPNTLNINTLFIQSNYLNFLSNEVLRKISVKTLALFGNPWKCPCLDRIEYWLYQTNGSTHYSSVCEGANIPTCLFPKSYSRTCIEVVDSQLTTKFTASLKNLTDLYTSCARLD